MQPHFHFCCSIKFFCFFVSQNVYEMFDVNFYRTWGTLPAFLHFFLKLKTSPSYKYSLYLDYIKDLGYTLMIVKKDSPKSKMLCFRFKTVNKVDGKSWLMIIFILHRQHKLQMDKRKSMCLEKTSAFFKRFPFS